MSLQRHGCISAAADVQWDAIVIGAGPAGALATHQAVRSGLQTLLIDAKPFPREKVCGGYLNARALAALRRVGLDSDAAMASAPVVRKLELIRGTQRTRVTVGNGRVVCRMAFDEWLVKSAVAAGAAFLDGAHAVVEPVSAGDCRIVNVAKNGEQESLRARVVVCADGLSRSSIRQLPELAARRAVESRVGIGAVIANTDMFDVGCMLMVIGRGGYVGIARIDHHRVNVAAAVVPSLLSRSTPVEVVSAILRQGNVVVPAGLDDASWRGTPPLTQYPHCVASERLFVIGDAAGFVEPFTGEGMAAALESAVAVAPIVALGAHDWDRSLAARWQAIHKQIVRDRQQTSRRLAWILHRSWAARAAMSVCQWLPGVPARIMESTSEPSVFEPASMIGSR